jgi:hypothetical protein
MLISDEILTFNGHQVNNSIKTLIIYNKSFMQMATWVEIFTNNGPYYNTLVWIALS